MKLSIVIPMFNCEQFISRCLTSIKNQNIDQEAFEIIIINDGSNDNSLKIAKGLSENFKNITIIDQENKGQSAARNLGVELAKGKYIWFIDSDDYIASNTLKMLLEVIESNNLDILRFSITKTDNLNLNQCRNLNSISTQIRITDGPTHIAENEYHEGPCGYMINSSFLENVGIRFIEGKIMEDMVFTAELFLNAKRIAILPLDVYRYVYNPKSTWNNLDSKHNRKAAMDMTYMAEKFNVLIKTLHSQNDYLTIARLTSKRNSIILNVFKRILQADFSLIEVNKIFSDLEKKQLIPRSYPYPSSAKKYFLMTLTNKNLFLVDVIIFRLFKKKLNLYINNTLRKNHLSKYDQMM